MVMRDSTLSNPNVSNDYQYNPVFQIKVRGLENDLEQVNTNIKRDKDKKITIGKVVTGKVLDGSKTRTGTVISIKKNEMGIPSYVVILDKDNKKEYKIDYSSCELDKESDKYKEDTDNYQIDVTYESKKFILNFNDFVELKKY